MINVNIKKFSIVNMEVNISICGNAKTGRVLKKQAKMTCFFASNRLQSFKSVHEPLLNS